MQFLPSCEVCLSNRIDLSRGRIDAVGESDVAHHRSTCVKRVPDGFGRNFTLIDMPFTLLSILHPKVAVESVCVFCCFVWKEETEPEYTSVPYTANPIKKEKKFTIGVVPRFEADPPFSRGKKKIKIPSIIYVAGRDSV